jgi:hypothetical protein
MFFTGDQIETMSDLVGEYQRSYTEATIHPYSGVVTLKGPKRTTLIDPDGRVAYDSQK